MSRDGSANCYCRGKLLLKSSKHKETSLSNSIDPNHPSNDGISHTSKPLTYDTKTEIPKRGFCFCQKNWTFPCRWLWCLISVQHRRAAVGLGFFFLEKWITIHTLRGHRIDKGVEGVGGGRGFHRGNKTTESAHETSHTNQYSFPSLQNHWAWNRFTAVMNALTNIRILGLLGYLGNVVFVQACEISKSHPNDGFSACWWFPVRLLTYDHSKCRI